MSNSSERNKILEGGVRSAVFCLLLDQIHKFAMLEIFDFEQIKFMKVTSFFNMVMVWNRGISFGMFQGYEYSNYFFMGFTATIVLILFYFMKNAKNTLEASGFGMIIGGACGNLIDRLRLDAVADFFDFHLMDKHWPAFNIADTCVFFGAAILIWATFKKDKKNEK